MTSIESLLSRHRRIALDTNVFIYYLEAHPDYVDLASKVFAWIERIPNTAVTSTLTMTELLVQPYRASNESQVNQDYGLLSSFPNLEWVAPTLMISDAAARIRARYRLRTPDALQVATAICTGASTILTNDPAFARVVEIEVGLLDHLR